MEESGHLRERLYEGYCDGVSGNYRNLKLIQRQDQVCLLNPKTGFIPKNSNILAATIWPKGLCHCRCFFATAFMAMDLAKTKAILNQHKDLEGYINLFRPEGN